MAEFEPDLLNEQIKWLENDLAPLVAKKFAARGFEAVYCPTKEEALKQAISYIPETDVVSWGGSVSINEIGLRPYVLEHNPVIDRDSAKTPEERVELMRKALLCDTFLMGANAAVQDGQLINIDGNGNRVAALCYGPKQVIAIVGMNKVVPTVEAGIERAHTVASPQNIGRFPGVGTPCAKTGMCGHCIRPDSVCAQVVRTRIHQLFIEPEGLDTEEMYVQGMSTSMPIDVQMEFLLQAPGPHQGYPGRRKSGLLVLKREVFYYENWNGRRRRSLPEWPGQNPDQPQ